MSSTKNLRIIGDTHGLIAQYVQIASEVEESVQVGDMAVGFNIDIGLLEEFQGDGTKHRFIRGNHDDPEAVFKMPGSIVDGTYDEEYGIMYIGGAWTIDQWHRTEGLSWWRNEELSIAELAKVYSDFVYYKPKCVISHDAPESVPPQMGLLNPAFGGMRSTRTGQALESMFKRHQPDYWYFGHWHKDATKTIIGTTFQCLDELSYVDVSIPHVKDAAHD